MNRSFSQYVARLRVGLGAAYDHSGHAVRKNFGLNVTVVTLTVHPYMPTRICTAHSRVQQYCRKRESAMGTHQQQQQPGGGGGRAKETLRPESAPNKACASTHTYSTSSKQQYSPRIFIYSVTESADGNLGAFKKLRGLLRNSWTY